MAGLRTCWARAGAAASIDHKAPSPPAQLPDSQAAEPQAAKAQPPTPGRPNPKDIVSSTPTAPVHPLAATLPLFGLVLKTPRLVLRPVWDEDINGMADAAVAGIHPEDEMPFAFPWTRDPPPGPAGGHGQDHLA